MNQPQNEMPVEEAFRILDQATAGIQTTRHHHQTMGAAFAAISNRIISLQQQVDALKAPADKREA